MNEYFNIFLDGYRGYASYLWHEITHPGWQNYFYWLLIVSAFFLILEWVVPWREKQPKFRKDFWLDFFYMFFNFFLFSLIIYNAASDVVVNALNDGIIWVTGFDLQASNPMRNWPLWAILLTGFVIRDHIQWWVHRWLHYSDRLWEFHKVHHSVEQMGFAAHLRYHWMETIVYRSVEYLPLALLGIGLYDFFIIHIFALAIGHFNHSNITVSPKLEGLVLGGLLGIVLSQGLWGTEIIQDPSLLQQTSIFGASLLFGTFVLGPATKIIFNSPEMHIWHHSYDLPEDKRYGVNFGISLAIWDYIFCTAHIPHSGQNIKLGFPGMKQYPKTFFSQITHGFSKKTPDDAQTINHAEKLDR